MRCLEDYGELETDSGDIIMLTVNSEHYLPLSQCETLIKQGVLQHIGYAGSWAKRVNQGSEVLVATIIANLAIARTC